MAIFYVEGQFVPDEKAVIPVTDLAVLRGYGVFDLFRTYNGKPFHWHAHLERLVGSAKRIGLTLAWQREELTAIVMETIRKNPEISNAYVRVVITGGASHDFATFENKPRLSVLISPIPIYPDWWYQKGVKLITLYQERNIPDAKSIDYIPATMAMKKARGQDAVEVLYMDAAGRILEGTSTNVFIFSKGRLITPGEGILSGITRKVVIETAQSVFPVEIRDVPLKELLIADEVFITGTSKGIVPVVQVDETTIGTGQPGVDTLRLTAMMHAAIEETITRETSAVSRKR